MDGVAVAQLDERGRELSGLRGREAAYGLLYLDERGCELDTREKGCGRTYVERAYLSGLRGREAAEVLDKTNERERARTRYVSGPSARRKEHRLTGVRCK